MPSTVLSITEPQDIYILGNACELTDQECTQVGITDDYSTMSFYAGDKQIAHIETIGFLYIFTKEQFGAVKQKIIDDEMYYEHSGLEHETGLPDVGNYRDDYAVILEDFVGDINVELYEKATGKCYLNNYDVTQHCYMFEHRDEDEPVSKEYGDLEELVRLPEGTKGYGCTVYEVMDRFNGATYLETAPCLDRVEDVLKVLNDYDSYDYQSITSNFADPLIYKPTFIGYLLAQPLYRTIGNKYATIKRNGGTYADKSKGENYNYLRPIFFSDIKKDIEALGTDFNTFLAEFIVASDVYIIKFNEWYKPLTRPLDKPEDYDLS